MIFPIQIKKVTIKLENIQQIIPLPLISNFHSKLTTLINNEASDFLYHPVGWVTYMWGRHYFYFREFGMSRFIQKGTWKFQKFRITQNIFWDTRIFVTQPQKFQKICCMGGKRFKRIETGKWNQNTTRKNLFRGYLGDLKNLHLWN